MKNPITRNSVIAALGLAALIAVIAAIPPATSQSAVSANLLGPADVNVVNTPTVLVGNAGDLAAGHGTPIAISPFTVVESGQIFGVNMNVFTVPAGKRLVIQHVAVRTSNLQTDNVLREAILTVGVNEYPLNVTTRVPLGQPLFLANHPILLVAEAGQVVSLTVVLHTAQASDASLGGTLTGYLEDAP